MTTQRIQFATTSDGVSIAVATSGEGPPLVLTPGWVSHLELNRHYPEMRAFYEALSQYRRVVSYDGRGTGLSDREVEDMSFTGRAKDIEAVADHLGLETFDLLGWSQSGPAAIAYAADHPDRVARLILYGTFARPFGVGREALCNALIALIRAEWSVGSKAIGEFVHPNADHEHEARMSLSFRQSSSAEVAAEILAEGMFRADVSHLLPKLSMPTLVLHRRDDSAVRFECGRQLASLIPNARLVPLPGDIHSLWDGDTESVLQAVAEFLDGEQRPATVEAPHVHGLVTILFTDMEGSTTLTQRVGDASAQEVLRTHNAIVRRAVQTHGGAIVKTAGDGFMVSFSSASKAVECAMVIQTALAQHNQERPELPIRVRMGLNAGEPIAEEQDLFGTAVIVASRIAERAQAGQILVSDVVRQLAAGKGFTFEERGRVTLKGFSERFRLYEVVR